MHLACGFKSHGFRSNAGLWSNRKTPVLQTGDSGAIPDESTFLNAIPWSSGDDSWPTPRQRWFKSIRDHLRISAQVRQLAERLGLNPGVCRFDSCSGHRNQKQITAW